MSPKIKNVILFVGIGAILVIVYLVFIKKGPEEASLTTTSTTGVTTSANVPIGTSAKADSEIAKDFLALLLSVKGINLDDSIFSDVAFSKLKDSSILLIQDGTQGRPNPFAPLGTDLVANPVTIDDLNKATNTQGLDSSDELPVTTQTKPTSTNSGSTGGSAN